MPSRGLAAIVFVCLLLHICLGSFGDRNEVWLVQGLFLGSFLGYFLLLKSPSLSIRNIWQWGLLFRLPFFFCLPHLSDDFYRFLWDGWLWLEGHSPFEYTPTQWVQQRIVQGKAYPEDLYNHLNSPHYHSPYPLFHQLGFALAALGYSAHEYLFSLSLLRFIILGAEMVVLHIFQKYQLRPIQQAAYFLNPLVIWEGIGNVHFEALVLAFLLLTAWGFSRKRSLYQPLLSFACAIATKLYPLVFLPQLFFHVSSRKKILLCVLLCFFLFVLFVPMGFSVGMWKSLDLYFRQFEFNSGVFALIKGIGIYIGQGDLTRYIGPFLGMLSAFGILLISYIRRRSDMLSIAPWLYLFYLLLSSTIHPWYLIPLIGLGVFQGLIFPLLWSYLICWSYIGYDSTGYQHPYLWILAEYLILSACWVWEFQQRRHKQIHYLLRKK
ncbi:MAG: hypothetical protein OXB93_06910 [Cytophagales bacterium]|nr:hypothetical protein [Cytophagales bacterium]